MAGSEDYAEGGGDDQDAANFSNDDLLKLLDQELQNANQVADPTDGDQPVREDGAGEKICFALNKNRRDFMSIKNLCDIKQKYPQGIDALQLFKIPTRKFQ